MNIGDAVEALKAGNHVTRRGWKHGKVLMYVPTEPYQMEQPYVVVRSADDGVVPWVCGHGDLLADDWVLMETIDREHREWAERENVVHASRDMAPIRVERHDRKKVPPMMHKGMVP